MDAEDFVKLSAFACVLLKREMVEKIGYLDEFFHYGAEDTEYTNRAIRNGWKIAIATDVSLIQLINASECRAGITENARGYFHWRRNEGHSLVHLTKQELYNSTLLVRRWVKYKAPSVFLALKRLRSKFFALWRQFMNQKK